MQSKFNVGVMGFVVAILTSFLGVSNGLSLKTKPTVFLLVMNI